MIEKKQFRSDIDIDVADRDSALQLIQHLPASQWRDGRLVKHNTGVYVTRAPREPIHGVCSFDYESAEAAGYIKLDIINNSVYQLVKSPQHLEQLLAKPPDWNKLNKSDFFSQIVHIGNHWDLYRRLREPLNSIPRMAMFLAVIRPAKRNLANQRWAEIAKTVWDKPTDGSYGFKRSHAVAYSHLVAVHMNLLIEQGI